MSSPLESLQGLVVTNVVKLHDYIQIHFGSQTGVTIYNAIEVVPKSIRVDDLVGKIVGFVTERKNAIEIGFRDGIALTVDMSPQAYRGPEALQLHRKGHPPVIWN